MQDTLARYLLLEVVRATVEGTTLILRFSAGRNREFLFESSADAELLRDLVLGSKLDSLPFLLSGSF